MAKATRPLRESVLARFRRAIPNCVPELAAPRPIPPPFVVRVWNVLEFSSVARDASLLKQRANSLGLVSPHVAPRVSTATNSVIAIYHRACYLNSYVQYISGCGLRQKEADLRPLCLDHLSLSDLTAVELIEVAAELGCAAVSLFATPLPLGPYLDLVNDRAAKAQVVSALRATGLSMGLVEPFLIDEAIDWDLLQRTAALTAQFGGTINSLCLDGDRARLESSLGRLADIARAEGAQMVIEGFTLSTARTVADALQAAEVAGGEVGLTIDTLHVMRTGGSWADIASLPPSRIVHVQLNDGPREAPADLYWEATRERLPPGHGEFDLAALIPLLPETARIAVEAPFRAASGATPLDRGRVLVEATRKLLA